MKMSVPHWVLAAVALAATIAPQVAAAFPALATVCGYVQQFAPLVLGALGLYTGSALTSKQVSK